jgi:hypothetical protein
MTTGQVLVDVVCAGWPNVLACGRKEMSTTVRDRLGAVTGAATVRDRLGAVTGAAFVVLSLVGNSLASAGPAEPAHPAGDQVLRDAARQVSSASVTAGVALEALGFAAFLVFLGYLADVLRRNTGGRGGGIAAGAGIVSAAVMVAVKLGSAVPVVTLWADHSAISPQLALVLNDLGAVAFVVSWLPAAIFVAAAAAALLRAGLVGRPTAYCGFVLGAAGLILSIIGIHDPFSANALAFVFGLFWLLAVSVRLAIRPGTGASARQASQRADAPVAVSA